MKNTKLSNIMNTVKPYAGLVLLIIFFSVFTGGQFLEAKNIKIVIEQSLALMLAAIGAFFVMTMGMMDLSISGVVCVCCYVMAKACTVNIPLGLVLTLLTGLMMGLFNGVTTSVLKVPSFLATLCTSYISTGAMTNLIASQAAIIPFGLYAANTFGFKITMVIVLILIAYVLFYLRPFGHQVRMIGCNENGAHYSAIDVRTVKILGYVINGGFAACAAFLVGIRAGTAAMSTGADLTFNVLVALTLGGFPFSDLSRARLSAAVVGSFTTYVLSNGMFLMGVNTTAAQLIKGSLILLIALLTSPTFRKMTAWFKTRQSNLMTHRRPDNADSIS